ncbi:hypothetical protein [Azonexus sp.]|uniref:hypothetical protein n=1 Tax=Azonexus sp. TaxID=1872668 RepID=UPI0027BACDAF|nr:hypothetical protein [Azonexus sp.]
MPIKPQAMQYQCRQCGWKITYAPLSDALLMEPPDTCDHCGSEELNRQPAGVIDNLLKSISTIVKRK